MEPNQETKAVSSKSDPQTQTDREPQFPLPKPAAQHRALALHIQKNGTPHVRRSDPLPLADPKAVRRQTHGPRKTGQVFPCRHKSTSRASHTQSSPSPGHVSAAPKAEISAPALCLSSASAGRRVHLPKTDRRT